MSGVCVEEGNTAVRVQAEVPHLVSLGGGRLSTAVTLHPLTQPITTLGNGNDVDIVVCGSGVEQRHCYIQNNRGAFSVYSSSQLTTVDGNPVTQPTRLTQGCILGLGHTNYFRFNHPVEARLMKSSLPDPKASLLPPTFYQGAYVGIEGLSPNHHQQSRMRDSWSEITDVLSITGYKNGDSVSHFQNGEVTVTNNKRLTSPSPAYNRNPSPYISQKIRLNSPPQVRSKFGKEQIDFEEQERLERQKVDEILAICSEYERQAQLERCVKPIQNRIKTNGSLPRDKRLNSPNSPGIQYSFSFDSSELTNGDLVNENEKKCESLKVPHSYENVILNSGSPRPRIKTMLNNKENYVKDFLGDNIENKIPLHLDTDHYGKINPISTCKSRNEFNNERSISSELISSQNPTKAESDVMFNSNGLNSEGRPLSIAEANIESKYKFLGFDPRKTDAEKEMDPSYQTIDGVDSVVKSDCNNSKESASLPLDINSFPDYEILDGNYTSSRITPSNDKFILPVNEKKPAQQEPNFEVETLKKERADVLKSLTSLKAKVSDLQIQEEELIREAEMEEALVNIEITSQEEKVKQEERRINILSERLKECDTEMEKCLDQQAESQQHFRMASDKYTSIIKTLELQCDSCNNEDFRSELMEALQQQHELLDIEKKGHEDLEFRLMEEEAGWLSKKEDLQRELSEAYARLDARKEKLLRLQHTTERTNNQFEVQRIELLRRIEEGRNRLNAINTELKNSIKAPLHSENCDSTSDDDEIGWNSKSNEYRQQISSPAEKMEPEVQKPVTPKQSPERQNSQPENNSLEEGRNRLNIINNDLKNLTKASYSQENFDSVTLDDENRKRGTSQDDLDRISRVTSGAPIDMTGNKLCKRTIKSLQEIERNRQIHLAKQGSLVIQEERQKVEELKKRVQDEVRAQWQQQRNSNCQSFTSATSDDSSSNSADQARDSGVSSEDVEKIRASSGEETKIQDDLQPLLVEDVDNETIATPESRPLSDASSYSDEQSTIKFRSRSNVNLQRPLTRYLPIRSETLDLRQHIETAGHQVDICQHIILDSTSCRGYLYKMGTRFHNWNKRWFVFDRQKRSLTYYTDRSEKKQRGGALFQAIEEVYVDHLNNLKSPSPKVTFVVKSVCKVYHLVAPSPEAMRIWVDVIFTGAEGYQQYNHH